MDKQINELDGDAAYEYARRRLGFWAYWCCRVVDFSRNNKAWWRVFDSLITMVVAGSCWVVGTWWLAVGVMLYALWNYTDGTVRSQW